MKKISAPYFPNLQNTRGKLLILVVAVNCAPPLASSLECWLFFFNFKKKFKKRVHNWRSIRCWCCGKDLGHDKFCFMYFQSVKILCTSHHIKIHPYLIICHFGHQVENNSENSIITKKSKTFFKFIPHCLLIRNNRNSAFAKNQNVDA